MKTSTTLTLFAGALLALTGASPSANAQLTQLFGNPTGGDFVVSGATWGAEFTVGAQHLVVTSLGAIKQPFIPYSVTHPVGIWDSGGALLRSATVTSSSPQIGDWRFQSITPLTLTSGQTYRIGALFASDNIMSGGTASIASQVTADPQWVDLTSSRTLTRPNQDVGQDFWAANMQFTTVPVPEPAAWAVPTSIGLLSFAVLRRYRSRRAS